MNLLCCEQGANFLLCVDRFIPYHLLKNMVIITDLKYDGIKE